MILDKDFYTLKEVGEELIKANIITRKTEGKGYHTVSKLVNLPEDNERYLRSSMPNGRSGGRKVSKEDLETYIAKHSPTSNAIREYSNRMAELEEKIANLEKENQQLHKQLEERKEPSSSPIVELDDSTLRLKVEGDTKLTYQFLNAIDKTQSFYSTTLQSESIGNKAWADMKVIKIKKKELVVESGQIDFSNLEIIDVEYSNYSIEIKFKNKFDKFLSFVFKFRCNSANSLDAGFHNDDFSVIYDKEKLFILPNIEADIKKKLGTKRLQKSVRKTLVDKLKKDTKYIDVAEKLSIGM